MSLSCLDFMAGCGHILEIRLLVTVSHDVMTVSKLLTFVLLILVFDPIQPDCQGNNN